MCEGFGSSIYNKIYTSFSLVSTTGMDQFSSVQAPSCVWLFVTPWTVVCQASLSITKSWSLLKLMSMKSVMPSNRLILCHPLLLLPAIFPSIRVFSNEINSSQFSSVQFSHSVVSNSLRPHEQEHARPPCPSPTPGIHPNPCPSSRWCHPSSVVPFSSCPQSFPASGSFPMSQLFTSGGQSFGVSAPASLLPTNTQDWSPLGWTGWMSLQSKGLSRVFSNTIVQKHQFFGAQLSS